MGDTENADDIVISVNGKATSHGAMRSKKGLDIGTGEVQRCALCKRSDVDEPSTAAMRPK